MSANFVQCASASLCKVFEFGMDRARPVRLSG